MPGPGIYQGGTEGTGKEELGPRKARSGCEQGEGLCRSSWCDLMLDCLVECCGRSAAVLVVVVAIVRDHLARRRHFQVLLSRGRETSRQCSENSSNIQALGTIIV
jgi:hypothetical protein